MQGIRQLVRMVHAQFRNHPRVRFEALQDVRHVVLLALLLPVFLLQAWASLFPWAASRVFGGQVRRVGEFRLRIRQGRPDIERVPFHRRLCQLHILLYWLRIRRDLQGSHPGSSRIR